MELTREQAAALIAELEGKLPPGANPLDTVRQHADTCDSILRDWARATIQVKDIANYNGANLAYNHAANTANQLGLSEQQKLGVAPFPGRPNETTIQVGDTNREILDRLERLAQRENEQADKARQAEQNAETERLKAELDAVKRQLVDDTRNRPPDPESNNAGQADQGATQQVNQADQVQARPATTKWIAAALGGSGGMCATALLVLASTYLASGKAEPTTTQPETRTQIETRNGVVDLEVEGVPGWGESRDEH